MYISCNAPDYSQTTKPRGRVTVELPCLVNLSTMSQSSAGGQIVTWG